MSSLDDLILSDVKALEALDAQVLNDIPEDEAAIDDELLSPIEEHDELELDEKRAHRDPNHGRFFIVCLKLTFDLSSARLKFNLW